MLNDLLGAKPPQAQNHLPKTENIVVQDNVLSDHNFSLVQSHLMGDQFPWFYKDSVVSKGARQAGSDQFQFQFVHQFHEGAGIVTSEEYWSLLTPIWECLQPVAFVKVKANLLPRTRKRVLHGYHVDTPCPSGLTAIFYLNTNNGYTQFKIGSKIESVANRLLIFPNSYEHSGTTCTDENMRVIINFNFIPYPGGLHSSLL